MQHKHVEIVERDFTYLYLKLPPSKNKKDPIITMPKAVEVYRRHKANYQAIEKQEQTNYKLRLTEFKNANKDFAVAKVEISTLETVMVNVLPTLTQPNAFLTVMVPVYVPAAVFTGTGMDIIPAPAANVAAWLVTAAKLLAGLAFHTMLYEVGVPVVAV
jgi:hypothetical protein